MHVNRHTFDTMEKSPSPKHTHPPNIIAPDTADTFFKTLVPFNAGVVFIAAEGIRNAMFVCCPLCTKRVECSKKKSAYVSWLPDCHLKKKKTLSGVPSALVFVSWVVLFLSCVRVPSVYA